MRWLYKNNLIHSSLKKEVLEKIQQDFVFPDDIIEQIENDSYAWRNYQNFSDPYKRIRVAYIEAARKRPAEFDKRLKNFIDRTKENKLIVGFGGVDKYY